MTTLDRTAEGNDEPGDFRVVTIARRLAAGGEAIAFQVARELGFRYVDDQIVMEAAEAAGVSPDVIDRMEHTAGALSPMLSAIDERSRSHQERSQPSAVPPEAYGRLIQQAIDHFAREGFAVIVAHGAGRYLAGRDGVLRVLVTGSPERRALRLADRTLTSDADARQQVEESDRQREEFLQRFYGKSAEEPADYDLVLNTDAISQHAAARAIIGIVRGG